jgi:hypothetical protein
MNGVGRAYYFLINESVRDDELMRADEWRRLHRRPDALPLPPEPVKAAHSGFVARLAGALPILRWFRVGGA